METGQEFAGDISVESVVIPDGVISIGERAFEDCPMLNEVVIPNSVTSIGLTVADILV